MKTRHIQLSILLTAISGILISCSLFIRDNNPSSKNVSTHIIVSNKDTIPKAGTYMWGAQVYKISYSKEIDLAEIDQRIKSNIQHELEQKGFKLVEENPDIIVGFAAALNESLTASDFNKAYGNKMTINFPQIHPDQTQTYEQGTLIIDIIDNKQKILLWRGAIMAEIKEDVPKKEKERRTQAFIQSLLTQFPQPH